MKLTTFGLAGLASLAVLVSLASAHEPEHGTDGAGGVLAWNNCDDFTFHCLGGKVSKQYTKTGISDHLGYCEGGCYETNTGAGCNLSHDDAVRRFSDNDGEADLALDVFPLAKPKETKQCSKDHRGVMTCRSGFCTVRPGDWCPKGKSCYDACNCCEVDRRGRRELRPGSNSEATKVMTAALPVDTPALPCRYPGIYGCSRDRTALNICTPDYLWALSSMCGTHSDGTGCCKYNLDTGSAYCDCRL